MNNYLQFILLQTEISRTYDFNGAMTTKTQQQRVGLVEVLTKLASSRNYSHYELIFREVPQNG